MGVQVRHQFKALCHIYTVSVHNHIQKFDGWIPMRDPSVKGGVPPQEPDQKDSLMRSFCKG